VQPQAKLDDELGKEHEIVFVSAVIDYSLTSDTINIFTRQYGRVLSLLFFSLPGYRCLGDGGTDRREFCTMVHIGL